MKKYTCPCCGYKMFDESPGSDDICDICFWHDDVIQLDDPFYEGGANKNSLFESQKNYQKFGAVEERLRTEVRKPTEKDVKDSQWRLVDPEKDKNVGDRKVEYYWIE